MAATPPPSEEKPAWWEVLRDDRRWWKWGVLGMLALLAATAGVAYFGRGDGEPPTEEFAEYDERGPRDPKRDPKKQKKKEDRQQDFALGKMRILPAPSEQEGEGTIATRRDIKPGHWASTMQSLRANNFDFVGEVETAAVNQRGVGLDLDRGIYRLATSRPVALPKTQTKNLEGLLFVPPRREEHLEGDLLVSDSVSAIAQGFDRVFVDHRLRSRVGGGMVQQQTDVFSYLLDYQYHFIVLAKEPSRYAFLSRLDRSFYPPHGKDDVPPPPYYQLVLPKWDQKNRTPPPLPSHPLTWSSIAYILWDEFDPDELTREQQQSLITWLHWGGQLVISGPGSWELLRGKFLEPYLPISAADSQDLSADALAELNSVWSHRPAKTPTLFVPGPGLQLAPHANAEPVSSTGKLLLRRQVGRGSIVLSAVRLSQPRERVNQDVDKKFAAAAYDRFFCQRILDQPVAEDHAGMPWRPLNVCTRLHYASRDGGERKSPLGKESPDEKQPDFDSIERLIRSTFNGKSVASGFDDTQHFAPGAAAWDDFSPASEAARQALRQAAGIKVPRADFVLWAVGVYLLVLVPVNWSLFKLLGRVEWAWAAAPLIAIGGTVAVVKLAQLDIGFAHARTEIALIELQPGYNQAHVTRYTALYASFSTGYEARFDNPNALIQPFARDKETRRMVGESSRDCRLRHDGESVTLSGFQVTSNSTGMLHSEEMLDLGGAITVSGDLDASPDDHDRLPTISNGTQLSLTRAIVVRRLTENRIAVAALGDLPAHRSAPLILREKHEVPDSTPENGQLDVRPLRRVAEAVEQLGVGDMRLIAEVPQELPGLEVSPPASQTRAAAVVLAHLRYAANGKR